MRAHHIGELPRVLPSLASRGTMRSMSFSRLAFRLIAPICVGAACQPGKTPCSSGFDLDAAGRCQPTEMVKDTGEAQPEDTGPPPIDTDFEFGPVMACTDPAETVSYVEVGLEFGLQEPSVWMGEHTENGSVAVADFDGDGDLDIVLGFDGEQPILYDRDGDRFVGSFLPIEDRFTQMGMADLDNDGRLDLTFGGIVNQQVLLNREGGWEPVDFPPVQFEGGSSVGHVKSIHPMDIDRDGIQDAYVLVSAIDATGLAAMDFIAWGVGDGTFVADTSVVPTDWGYQKGFDVQWFDWDEDGWQDIYVVNERTVSPDGSSDRPVGNFLLANREGNLELANDDCMCHIEHDGMGAGLGDFNRDGRADLMLSATGKNVLLQQLEDRTFVDVGQATGADTLDGTNESMAWSAIMVDFDNDGMMDIAEAEGDLWHAHTDSPNIMDMAFNMIRQVAPSEFELANEFGFGQMGSWRSIVAADHNGDGVLDFIVSDVEHRPIFLLSEGCTSNAWFQVAAPHGSQIQVDAGESTWTGFANTASSFGGVVEPVAHFGLGAISTVDRVQVWAPNGSILELNGPIEARRRITLK
jgi:hypothetical protein